MASLVVTLSNTAPPSAPAQYISVIVGAILSKVQLNGAVAILLFPAASVKVPAATSIVISPSPEGVSVAVYFLVDIARNESKEPPVTVISS